MNTTYPPIRSLTPC